MLKYQVNGYNTSTMTDCVEVYQFSEIAQLLNYLRKMSEDSDCEVKAMRVILPSYNIKIKRCKTNNGDKPEFKLSFEDKEDQLKPVEVVSEDIEKEEIICQPEVPMESIITE